MFVLFNTRQYPKDEESEISLSKPSQSHYIVESDDIIIEKENQKMLERKKQLRPKRNMVKKDTSLDNPTPQMLEIMARMREKSISPPICTKRHRHNSNCQQGFRIAPEITSPPNKLTPAMEEVLKKRSNRRNSTDSIDSSSGSSYSPSMSPDLFDSGDETEIRSDEESYEEDESIHNDATVYYSPCCNNTPDGHCIHHEHSVKATNAKVPVRNYSTRRLSLSSKQRLSITPPHKKSSKKGRCVEMRVTRSRMRSSASPEI
ncbi:hypothetical protein Avbf_04014 [Armadillidium vulgare]|nr:hypothetical protein Avbf_04014 [Armadillidium vulgare]